MTSYKPNPELVGPLYGKDPWPLRFHTHGFGAVCFNTLTCSIIYHGHEFGTRKLDTFAKIQDGPSGPPPVDDWRDEWSGSHSFGAVGGRTFNGPVELHWTSMDGSQHFAIIDFDEMFRDRIILHNVRRSEVKERWLEAKSTNPVSPGLMLEVNDRVVNVFMRATVATENEQIPGNMYSHFRDDLILAWTHAY
jgi:hypothetical protein